MTDHQNLEVEGAPAPVEAVIQDLRPKLLALLDEAAARVVADMARDGRDRYVAQIHGMTTRYALAAQCIGNAVAHLVLDAARHQGRLGDEQRLALAISGTWTRLNDNLLESVCNEVNAVRPQYERPRQ